MTGQFLASVLHFPAGVTVLGSLDSPDDVRVMVQAPGCPEAAKGELLEARPLFRRNAEHGCCVACDYWRRLDAVRGVCRQFSDDATIAGSDPRPGEWPDPLALVAPFQGAAGGQLLTEAAFGCVQWSGTVPEIELLEWQA